LEIRGGSLATARLRGCGDHFRAIPFLVPRVLKLRRRAFDPAGRTEYNRGRRARISTRTEDGMIKGVHAMFYSSQPEKLRSFIKDKLRLTYTDVGGGWLIFNVAEGDIGCHPTDGDPKSGTHDISLYCDDLEKTVAELKSRGVAFDEEIADHGYGFVTSLTMPGGVKVQIYQPKYVKRTSRPSDRKTSKRSASKRSTMRPARSKRPTADRRR
jgi:hypothetical protein